MKTIKVSKAVTNVKIDDECILTFKTVTSRTTTGTLVCLYLTQVNNFDLDLVGIGGGVEMMHHWDDAFITARSAIKSYGRTRNNKNGVVHKGRITLMDGSILSLEISEDRSTVGILCGEKDQHIIYLAKMINNNLDVTILRMKDNKIVLHKIVNNDDNSVEDRLQ